MRNMSGIVLATAYFCMSWIGNSDKRALIARGLPNASLGIHEVPDFHLLHNRG